MTIEITADPEAIKYFKESVEKFRPDEGRFNLWMMKLVTILMEGKPRVTCRELAAQIGESYNYTLALVLKMTAEGKLDPIFTLEDIRMIQDYGVKL